MSPLATIQNAAPIVGQLEVEDTYMTLNIHNSLTEDFGAYNITQSDHS